MIRRYRIRIGDGYSLGGNTRPQGEHPLGLAVDIYPGPGGSWTQVSRLARWAEPRQNRPRPPFRWVGYSGDCNHGRGNHLHLSWQHSPRPLRPAGAQGLGLRRRARAGRSRATPRPFQGPCELPAARSARRTAVARTRVACGPHVATSCSAAEIATRLLEGNKRALARRSRSSRTTTRRAGRSSGRSTRTPARRR